MPVIQQASKLYTSEILNMFLLFDIGGTKMRLGVSSGGESLEEYRIEPTPKDFEQGMRVFAQLVDDLKDGRKFDMAGGGITGALNKEKDTLARSSHLPLWIEQPVKQRLKEIIGSDVYLENDSAIVGLGEAVAGAGQGFKIIAYLTISTGIGGARIVNGKIDANIFGFEPGHQIIDADGSLNPNFLPDESGNTKGEFESLVSGSAIQKRYGKTSFELEDENAWNQIHWLLAQGMCNTILHWSPEIVVLGGGVVESNKVSIEKIKLHLNEVLKIFPEHPEIRKAELKDLSGLHGALAYLKQVKALSNKFVENHI